MCAFASMEPVDLTVKKIKSTLPDLNSNLHLSSHKADLLLKAANSSLSSCRLNANQLPINLASFLINDSNSFSDLRFKKECKNACI